MRDVLDPQWYALRVAPQREYVVAYLLRQAGNATLVPTEVRTHKRSSYSKGKVEFAVPIIPGCVFAGFRSAPLWYELLKNDMILGPIGMDGRPWRLRIQDLMRFFVGVNDGCMVMDDGLRLIHIPGRTPVRALTTRTRTISPRKRKKSAASDAPPVQAPGKSLDFLSRFVYGGMV